jgi:hypothetical protein
MATRTATIAYAPDGHKEVSVATWAGLTQASADVGSSVQLPGADRCAQLSGTLGTGGGVPLEGSLDGSVWGALHDLAGNAITLDAIGELVPIAEATLYVRCGTTAGDGDTNLTVKLLSRRST